MVIALNTDDFNLHETDISELTIGESQTIGTDSGKVIDLLRTADGVEVYIDGELLDMDMNFMRQDCIQNTSWKSTLK